MQQVRCCHEYNLKIACLICGTGNQALTLQWRLTLAQYKSRLLLAG